MTLVVYNMQKKKVGEAAWPEAFGDYTPSKGRIYQVVVQQLTNRRQGDANVKGRGEVSGSNRKIYRQKGTGRARHGDNYAPIFVGGGRAFGPRKRDWSSTIPKKLRRGVLKDILVMKKGEEKLWLVDELTLKGPKTKEMAAFFEKWGIPSGLVVLAEKNEAVQKSIRNLEKFEVQTAHSVSPVELLRYDHLILTPKSYEKLIQRCGV